MSFRSSGVMNVVWSFSTTEWVIRSHSCSMSEIALADAWTSVG